MIKKAKDYYSKIGQISDPYEKARLYETIDYTEICLKLDNYLENKMTM
jgi:hypothetical protein